MSMGNGAFAGQVAVVCGAGQGIGKAIADSLTQAGATVARLDLKFSSEDKSALNFGVDIRSQAQVVDAIATVEAKLGPIALAVQAAGILHMAELGNCSAEQWLDTFSVNTHGTFYFCQAVTQHMKARRSGALVVVSSNAATTPRLGMGAYAASKAAVNQMVRCLGLELAPFNVRCNLVAPGSTDTDMQRTAWGEGDRVAQTIAGDLSQFRLGIPLGRIATPAMIADAALFLLSNQAAHITLQTLTVDGGASLAQ